MMKLVLDDRTLEVDATQAGMRITFVYENGAAFVTYLDRAEALALATAIKELAPGK